MATNQHRWKAWVNDDVLAVLEDSAEHLQWAWKTDNKDPKSYPLNTHSAFAEIDTQLYTLSREKSKEAPQVRESLPTPRLPKCLSELVAERIIKAVFEDQNDENYHTALKVAASQNEKGASAWRKILLAVDAAYQISVYGVDLIPKPRVQFLHRNLLKIADVTRISDLTHEGIVEFLDDICPCGKRHRAEAIRKLRKRFTVGRSARH